MQVTACTSFSIGTSTKGMPIAAAEIDFFCGHDDLAGMTELKP